MSATNRGASRIAHDAYSTPGYSIEPMLDLIHIPHISTFLEPCRGRSAIYNRIRCHRRYHAEIAEGNDYLTYVPPGKVNIIITNPPFSLAVDFLKKSLSEADTVVYLLRLNFLESVARHDFWKAHKPSHLFGLSKRPVFVWACKGVKGAKKGCGALYEPESTRVCEVCGGRVAPGTDACGYGWYCWDKAGLIKAAPGVDVL
jgi:hypothetical protein